MKKSVCKTFGNGTGSGFFCQIEIDKDKIPTLITNYHVINDTFLEKNNKLRIQLGNETIPRFINLNKNKKLYSSNIPEYDIMIIKLDEGDPTDGIEYLEIDDSLLQYNSELLYEDNSIYILHYLLGKEIKVSFGRGIIKEKGNIYNMIHKCNTSPGSSGSPIFNLTTNKVIGIHKSYFLKEDKNKSVNLGTFLKYPLLKVKTLFQKTQKKEKNPRYIKQVYKMDRNFDNKSHQNLMIKALNNQMDIKINDDNLGDGLIKKINDFTKNDTNKFDVNKYFQNISNINNKNEQNIDNKKDSKELKDKENIKNKDNQNINGQVNQNIQNINNNYFKEQNLKEENRDKHNYKKNFCCDNIDLKIFFKKNYIIISYLYFYFFYYLR